MIHFLPSLFLGAAIAAQAATIVDFEQPLTNYPGLTFSPTISRWLGFAGSVVNNPNLGPVSPTYGICVGPCGGGIVGSIVFASPQTVVGIYALSGPGPDLINPGTQIQAFDSASNLLDQDVANTTVQYDFVSVRGQGIARVELRSIPANNEAWDELVFSPTGFILDAAPRSVPAGTNCEFVLAKQLPTTPVLLVAVDILGIPLATIVASGQADFRGRWSYRVLAVPNLPGLAVTFRGYSLDPQLNLIWSNDVVVSIP